MRPTPESYLLGVIFLITLFVNSQSRVMLDRFWVDAGEPNVIKKPLLIKDAIEVKEAIDAKEPIEDNGNIEVKEAIEDKEAIVAKEVIEDIVEAIEAK